MKKTYLILLLIIVCCFINQYVSGQGLVKIWEKEFPSVEIDVTASFQRNQSHMDLDGDNMPDLTVFKQNEDKAVVRMSSGDVTVLPLNYEEIKVTFQDFVFAGYYNFFTGENGLKQMLMVKRDGNKIIGILIGIVGEDEVNFNAVIPDEINDNGSSIININDWNNNNFEEIKVTFQDTSQATMSVSIWEYSQ